MAGNRQHAGGVASAVKNFHRIQDDAAIEDALAALTRPEIGWSLNTLLSAVERAQAILCERVQRKVVAGVNHLPGSGGSNSNGGDDASPR